MLCVVASMSANEDLQNERGHNVTASTLLNIIGALVHPKRRQYIFYCKKEFFFEIKIDVLVAKGSNPMLFRKRICIDVIMLLKSRYE